MKKTLGALGILGLCAAVSFASTINNSTATNGTQFSGFDNGSEQDTDLAGAVASVGGDVCTFITVASNSTCTGIGFVISLTPPAANTGGQAWDIHNNAAAGIGAITSLTLNIQPSNSVFDICLDNTNAITQGNCAHGGGSVSTKSGGSAISADVAYTNLATDLLSGGGHPFSPLYGQVTFNFTTAFTGGMDFTFGASSDLFAPATPEPATYGMVGIALVL